MPFAYFSCGTVLVNKAVHFFTSNSLHESNLCTIVLKHCFDMPNRENNVSRTASIRKHVGKLGNTVEQKCS